MAKQLRIGMIGYGFMGRAHSNGYNRVKDFFDLEYLPVLQAVAARDAAKARAKGVPPGGMIMIHGTPIDEEYPEWYFSTLDWTEGCIAMKNADMREVWNLVKDGTLIEIRP